jgi:GNAT superfamily N-acetyltransferase
VAGEIGPPEKLSAWHDLSRSDSGELAVDKAFHGQGKGTGLLRDAVVRIVQAADIAGIRAILIHAISEEAKRFYERYGFVASPVDPPTVMISVAEAARIIGAASGLKPPAG